MQGRIPESGLGKRWRWVGAEDVAAVEALARGAGVHPLVAGLMWGRGLDTPDLARAFLEPKLSGLHDPALLPGATAAAERLVQAVKDGQRIVVYGDYDVDGVTGSAILWHVLGAAGAEVSIYIPHRIEEGYGLNAEAIESLAAQDPKPLVISVDCGITACGVADRARALGLDLIITDHHHFDLEALPAAQVLVHPGLPGAIGEHPQAGEKHPGVRGQLPGAGAKGQLPGGPETVVPRGGKLPGGGAGYPNQELCGAGVAFKVAWQFARVWCGSDRVSDTFRGLLLDLMAYVALGTVADVVPLVGENRALTVFGLGRIKHTSFAGLNALIDASRLREEKVDAYHVGFVLGPRLNACGRMGHARDAAKLLTDAEPAEARELAEFLTGENDRRRAAERDIFEKARAQVVERGDDAADRRAIVVAGEGWHTGVVGIVASRLVEAFSRPAVVLGIDNGSAQGSARSVEGVSIHAAITACDKHLVKFGGHAMAAGMTLASGAIDAFRTDLIEQVNAVLGPEELCGQVAVDAVVTPRDCTLEVFANIRRLAPFGRGNPSPRLLLRGVRLQRPASRMGGEGRHLQLHLHDPNDPSGPVLRAVGWRLGDWVDQLPAGVGVDIVFKPEINTWRGVSRPDLHVEDVRLEG